MKRRTLLAALGTATAMGTAGCLDSSDEREGMRLGWVAAVNFDAQPHTVTLRVERGDEVVHESSHRLPESGPSGSNGAVADCAWADARGEYTVLARLDDGEWHERALSELRESRDGEVDCAVAQATYHHDVFGLRLSATCDEVASYEGGCAFANRSTTPGGRGAPPKP